MDMNPASAARSYGLARPVVAVPPDAGQTDGLVAAAQEFEQILSQGEATARAAMTGNADPHALVQALSASELAVETAVTVRDKVVEAYQEILRMPV
ncbi:flagellar hook-basal body complex protein FliE [Gemmobacter caeni]|jgi:flagellar hook-basal body complex protein FliE|uniref:Flagellar hook-basal body complex protein FliE n=2 Tax=Gemmobacter TaxID=204456 RepID=A0A2T6AQU2_9RHOB|nr:MULTISPECIES: flagellar hook-basal body complex protein FliE [Gemmobacter]OJY33046.1 MAG: flagellar hook-basal body protein FliE [Rhodobacterales bacterium 65-51]PTX46195.1 flagellar hook-basal body complex protein FliE [Gemmobacter caeni]TWI94440.1 flagellar hook-basal body complex protein FliE [Gemmobacter caeni]GHC29764.1 flagellar hook-basal body protein FliE [Gemmobacter nanjingensis]